MRLFEHSEFEQALLRTAAASNVTEQQIYHLPADDEVIAMLRSPEYREIREDYDANSRRYFERTYRPPKDLSFASSPALFPTGSVREALAADYRTQCELLFANSAYPPFDEVLARFEGLKDLL